MAKSGGTNHTWTIEDDAALVAAVAASTPLLAHYTAQHADARRARAESGWWDAVAGLVWTQTDHRVCVTGAACRHRWQDHVRPAADAEARAAREEAELREARAVVDQTAVDAWDRTVVMVDSYEEAERDEDARWRAAVEADIAAMRRSVDWLVAEWGGQDAKVPAVREAATT